MRIYASPALIAELLSPSSSASRRVLKLVREGAVSLWTREEVKAKTFKVHRFPEGITSVYFLRANSSQEVIELFDRGKIPLFTTERENDSIMEEMIQSAKRVLISGRFILGENLKKLEQELSRRLGGYFVGTGSGTDAIELMLRASVPPPGAVITSPFTFFATVESVIHAGLNVLFVDVDENSGNISPEALEKFLREKCFIRARSIIHRKTGLHVKGVLVVHLYGQPANLEAISDILKGTDAHIFEDTAQAFGASVKVKSKTYPAGTFGKAGAISFYPSKPLGAAGDSGGVVTCSKKLAERVKALRNHGIVGKKHMLVGKNSRLDEIQISILLLKLRHFEKWQKRREKIAQRYVNEFSHIKGIQTLTQQPHVITHAWHLFTVKTPLRDELQKFLSRKNIESRIYYPEPLFRVPAIKKSIPSDDVHAPVAEKLSKQVLSIPCGALLSQEEINRVIEAVREFFSRRGGK